MEKAAFRYDKSINRIIPIEGGCSKTEAFPVSFVFLNENGKEVMWCPEHNKYERLKKNGKTESGCMAKQYMAYVGKQPKAVATFSVKKIPWRWQVIHEPGEYVELSIDTVSVRTERKFIWDRFSNEDVPIVNRGRTFVRYCFGEKSVVSNSLNDNPWYDINMEFDAECWKEISHRMMTCTQESIKNRLGIQSFLPTEMVFWPSDVKLFMNRPYDFYIAVLRRFIGNDFDRLFPVSYTNNFPNLCYYLHISPPKSILKEYLKSPYLIILYFWLIRTGFTDINAIRMFFDKDVLGEFYLTDARYDYRENELYHTGIPCDETGMDFSFLVKWLLKNGKKESVIARQIVSALKSGWKRQEFDELCRLFHQLYPQLPQETRDMVKEIGFNTAGIRVLNEAIQDTRIRICKVRLGKAAIALNQTHNGIDFRVISDTRELPEIGRALHNCVAGYADNVIDKDTVIVVGEKDGKYVACIELRSYIDNSFTMHQALGKFNELLEGDVLQACRLWVAKNHISSHCRHLQ